MSTPVLLAIIITLLPAAAWAIEFLWAAFTRRMPPFADKLSTAAIWGSLGCSLWLMFGYVLPGGGIAEPHTWSGTWFSVGSGAHAFVLDLDVMVDNLTVIMFCVVTIVSALVHLYSIGYMHDEDRYPRFFSYLSMFSASMLACVMTSNILMLFIFWELVGVCSYFLIGFFITKKSAGDASKKAFVTNRIGDGCFMAGIFLVYGVLAKHWPGEGVLSFTRIWESIGLLGVGEGPWVGQEGLLTAAGILIFMGCVTKSAQFPLHIWLPDAMEGPTPVSALIHAATMVAAGVYMIVRMFPLLAGEGYLSGDYFDSTALTVIAITGAVTSIFAGTIALVQTDLKKGLAYSTCSQLGYMVMAVGLGSITAAMFHLFTHAFFKACLFLGSGSVIHAVHSQEMSDMGGLRKKMPVTHATFLISCLAIAGCFLFSGFLSKEAVLGQAWAWGLHKGTLLAWVPIALAGFTALLTAFYMFRLHILTFYGKPGNQAKFDHAHESPRTMTIPLIVLAFLAIFSAGIAYPGLPGSHWFPDRVNDEVLVKEAMLSEAVPTTAAGVAAFEAQQVHHVHHELAEGANEVVTAFHEDFHHAHWPVLGISLVALLVMIPLAFLLFGKLRDRDLVGEFKLKAPVPEDGKLALKVVRPLDGFRNVLKNLWYVDWFFCQRVVPTVKDVMLVVFAFDKRVIDGIVNGAAWFVRLVGTVVGVIDKKGVDGSVRGTCNLAMASGNGLRRLVNGKIQDYVKYTVIGMGVLLIWVILAN